MTSPVPTLSMEDLASRYGFAAAFLNQSPELKQLFSSAIAGQWTAAKFQAALFNTNWYRTQSETQRQWSELQGRDPATAAQRVSNQVSKIKAVANKQGISISPARLQQIAADSLRLGYPDERLTELIGAEWHYSAGGGTSGGAATMEDTLRKLGADYGVSLTDSQVGAWIGGALQGKYTEDHFHDFVRDMARSRYPGLTQYLDQGMTVRQIAAPYVQSYSSVLETGVDTVDLNNNYIQKALQGTPSPDGKKPPMMQSLFDFEVGLRKDSRWQTTKAAHAQSESATTQILRDFGFVS